MRFRGDPVANTPPAPTGIGHRCHEPAHPAQGRLTALHSRSRPPRTYGFLQTRPHGSPPTPTNSASRPPGQFRTAPLPHQCWVPPVRAPGQDFHLRSQTTCLAHSARPSGLASVEPRTYPYALPPWGILVINPGEKTMIAGTEHSDVVITSRTAVVIARTGAIAWSAGNYVAPSRSGAWIAADRAVWRNIFWVRGSRGTRAAARPGAGPNVLEGALGDRGLSFMSACRAVVAMSSAPPVTGVASMWPGRNMMRSSSAALGSASPCGLVRSEPLACAT